jgi:phosphoketolase
MDAYWRAANYLSVGQLYRYDNPLLKKPLELSHVKPLVVGHWGTTPGQNFIYVHLNRVIKKYDLDTFYIAGPGHGGPALVGNTYLEGTYSEIYPDISQDEAGFRVFGPDGTLSNMLGAVFEVTSRQWEARTQRSDEFLAPDGRVLDSMLSEHQCEGWLEGYLLIVNWTWGDPE